MDTVSPRSPAAAEHKTVAIGAAAALACVAIPFTRVVFHPLATLVHELGHTVANWVFGRPAIPALDFVHGGGLTWSQDRSRVLVALIAAGWVWAVFALRRRPRAAVTVAILAALWCVMLASSTDDVVILVAGHAFELLFATLFLYRAVTGRGTRRAADRGAHAFAGVFVWLTALGFAWALTYRPEARIDYEAAKGGGAWMDLSQVARDHAGVTLERVAAGYLFLVLLVPAAVWAVWRARRLVDGMISWLAEPRDEPTLRSEDAST